MHQAKYSYLYGGVTPYLKSYYQQYPNNNNVTILFKMLYVNILGKRFIMNKMNVSTEVLRIFYVRTE